MRRPLVFATTPERMRFGHLATVTNEPLRYAAGGALESSTQRAGSGVTFTNMSGRRLRVSMVIFEIKPLTLSGTARSARSSRMAARLARRTKANVARRTAAHDHSIPERLALQF